MFLGIDNTTNITRLAALNSYNGGGGMYPAFFYFFAGYVGVIAAVVILGYIIRFAFKSSNGWHKMYQAALIVYSFRWYLYSPVSLYRTIMVNFTLLVLLAYVANKYVRKRSK